jgi:hypothetical protein
MNKKLVAGFFVSIFLLSLVSASNGFGGFDLRGGSEQVIDWIVGFSEPFLRIILGGEDHSGLLLFERFLFFLILLAVIYVTLSQVLIFKDQPAVLWTISIVIPILSVRFMSFAWLNTVLLQYQVLGVALTGILPFIIYLFFLHNVSESSTVRKIGWVFFIVIYFGLWSTVDTETYGQVYFWTMLIALVFLLLDGTIHQFFQRQRRRRSGQASIYETIVRIDKKMRDLREDQGIDRGTKSRLLRDLRDQRKDLYKQLKKV